jgi:GAF domain-containing protein
VPDDALLDVVVPVAIALSVEQDFNRLLERIVLESKALCRADAGTLYLRTPDDRLEFIIMRTTSLGLALGGTTGQPISYPPLPLYDPATGHPNHHNVATYTALEDRLISIADVYREQQFDFSGTRKFDQMTGYRSTSLLTVPLKHGPVQVIGVIQLLNAQDPANGAIVPFDESLHPVVQALASLAAIALVAHQRVQGLRQQIQELRVEIDEARKIRQVAEITETDYFRDLRQRARALRERVAGSDGSRSE